MSEADDDTIHIEPEPIPKTKLVDVHDVDATWNGEGSLDEHRQKEFSKLTQPGFGDAGKAKLNGE